MGLVLYSTEGCHLCEQAAMLYLALGHTNALQKIDIAFDDELFLRYAVTIPVLSFLENGHVIANIDWPFDSFELKTWLVKHGIN